MPFNRAYASFFERTDHRATEPQSSQRKTFLFFVPLWFGKKNRKVAKNVKKTNRFSIVM